MRTDFYVYVYLDPRKPGLFKYGELKFGYEPFYIGKGHGNRCYSGIKNCRKIEEKWYKWKKIKKIKEVGLEPIVIKIIQKITEAEAFLKEKELIGIIGRFKLKTGPLTNMTDGGEGTVNIDPKWKKVLSKPIIQLNDDNSIIAKFSSIKDAAEKTGIHKQNISSVVNGKCQHAGGFKWKYKNPEDILQGHLKKTFSMPKHSEATKKKMRKKKSKSTKERMRLNHPSKQAVIQIDKDENIIKEWISISEASRVLKIKVDKIIHSCNYRRPRITERFIWKDPVRREKAKLIGAEKDKGRKARWIPVLQINPSTNEIVKEWECAALIKDFSIGMIGRRCRDKNLNPYAGFIWKYK
jgi:hypothetical protein